MSANNPYQFVRENYEIHEYRHAISILSQNYPNEWNEILEVLNDFQLLESHILAGGGNKTQMAQTLDNHFTRLEWRENRFETGIQVTQFEIHGRNSSTQVGQYYIQSSTHAVDEYKNTIGVEVEWNNKDPFYDRDLNNFRLLYELRAISVGVIITRADELQRVFNRLGRLIGRKYGMNTTHMGKLLPRLEGGAGGGCPVVVFGIQTSLYVPDVSGVVPTAGPITFITPQQEE